MRVVCASHDPDRAWALVAWQSPSELACTVTCQSSRSHSLPPLGSYQPNLSLSQYITVMAARWPMSPVIPDRMSSLPCSAAPQLSPHLSPPRLPFALNYPASLSRHTSTVQSKPKLFHSLQQAQSSVLSVAADDRNIYTGSQDGQICVSAPLPRPEVHVLVLKLPVIGLGQRNAPIESRLATLGKHPRSRIRSRKALAFQCIWYVIPPR